MVRPLGTGQRPGEAVRTYARQSPAAFAALTPFGESSSASARSGVSSSSRSTARYTSGAGFEMPPNRVHPSAQVESSTGRFKLLLPRKQVWRLRVNDEPVEVEDDGAHLASAAPAPVHKRPARSGRSTEVAYESMVLTSMIRRPITRRRNDCAFRTSASASSFITRVWSWLSVMDPAVVQVRQRRLGPAARPSTRAWSRLRSRLDRRAHGTTAMRTSRGGKLQAFRSSYDLTSGWVVLTGSDAPRTSELNETTGDCRW